MLNEHKRAGGAGRSWLSRVWHSAPMSTAAGTVGALVVILGAGAAIDDRYAHAGDVRKIESALEINRLTAEVSVLEIRRSSLEDKVYDAAARGQTKRAAPAEQAILSRYSAELRDVSKQITEKRLLIDQLKAGKK